MRHLDRYSFIHQRYQCNCNRISSFVIPWSWYAVFHGDMVTKTRGKNVNRANPLSADTPYKYELVGRLHSKVVPPLCLCVSSLLTASEVHSIFYPDSPVTSIVGLTCKWVSLSYYEPPAILRRWSYYTGLFWHIVLHCLWFFEVVNYFFCLLVIFDEYSMDCDLGLTWGYDLCDTFIVESLCELVC